MYRNTIAAKVLSSLLVVLLATVTVALTLAIVDDYARRDVLPLGATIDSVKVEGLSRAAATKVVEDKVEAVLLSPATVTFRGKSFPFDTPAYASVDVEGMVGKALAAKSDALLPYRVLDRVTAVPLGVPVERAMTIDKAKLGAWIAQVEPQVFQPAVDATYSVAATGMVLIPEVDGHRIDTTAAVPGLTEALLAGEKDFELPDAAFKPTLTKANFGYTIFVRRSARRLWFYNGDQLLKTYPIAVGTPGYPTPLGVWKVINKRKWPSWSNPAPNGWGSGMPAYIGPGVSNPLGTRAIDLDAAGIRFHGTTKTGSIGTAASHGCMRMLRRDVEEFFELVPIGTRVIIVQ